MSNCPADRIMSQVENYDIKLAGGQSQSDTNLFESKQNFEPILELGKNLNSMHKTQLSRNYVRVFVSMIILLPRNRFSPIRLSHPENNSPQNMPTGTLLCFLIIIMFLV